MDAILEYYLEDGHIEKVNNYTSDSTEKGRIIYEVIRVIKGVPLFYEDHIKRLESSFNLTNKVFSYKYDKIKEYIDRLIEANKIDYGNIKITFDIKTDTMKVFSIKHSYPSREMYEKGVKTIFYHGERTNPNAKVVDNDFRAKVTEEIKKNNAYEAILVNKEGYITEGSKSNIFMIENEKLYTSPLEDVLPGVTRGRVIALSKKIGLDFEEKAIKFNKIDNINSMFISGTSPNILPISLVDEKVLNIENKVLRNLMKKFEEEINKYVENYR